MKQFKVITLVGLISLSLFGCNSGESKESPTTPDMKISEQSSNLEKVGYSFGYDVGKNNRDSLNDIDVEAFVLGFRDAYAKTDNALTKEDATKALETYKKHKEEEFKAKAESNIKASKDFLEKNAKVDGVKTTDSGLQYKVVKAGTGTSPKATDTVEVHYEGTLLDGTIFDSSIERKETVTFPLSNVIAGWTEGVQLMKEGAEYEFYIPANLAYGETGAPPKILPNSTLIFKIELKKVNPKPAVPATKK